MCFTTNVHFPINSDKASRLSFHWELKPSLSFNEILWASFQNERTIKDGFEIPTPAAGSFFKTGSFSQRKIFRNIEIFDLFGIVAFFWAPKNEASDFFSIFGYFNNKQAFLFAQRFPQRALNRLKI